MRSWFALRALALVLGGMCLTGCGTDLSRSFFFGLDLS